MPEQSWRTGLDAVQKLTDRLFFAIFPDAAAAARIAQLAHDLRGKHGLKGKPFATERFHITVHYLGDYAGLPRGIVAAAIEAAATVAMPPFAVVFDRALSFPTRLENRPFVLQGSDGVVGLTTFQRTLGTALDQAGLGSGTKSEYTPHVTLLYDDCLVPEGPVDPLDWIVREFVLVHSLLGQSVHVPLARWPLPAD
jgi:2'-5' RNA ligase